MTLERIPGHRDGDSTSCPGDALYAQPPELRARATRYAGPLAGITVRASSTRIRTRPVQLSGQLRFPDGSSPAGAGARHRVRRPGRRLRANRRNGLRAGRQLGGARAAQRERADPRRVPRRRRAAAAGLLPGRDPRPPHPPARPLVAPPPPRPRARRLGHDHARPAGGRVEVRIERRVGRRWVRVQRKRINIRGDRYLTRVKLRCRGLDRVTVLVPGATKRLRVALALTISEADHEPQSAPGVVDRADLVVDERVGQRSSRTTSSVRSVSTFEARLGHVIHSPAAGSMRSRSAGIRLASSARRR